MHHNNPCLGFLSLKLAASLPGTAVVIITPDVADIGVLMPGWFVFMEKKLCSCMALTGWLRV